MSGNSFYYSVQNPFSSCLLFKKIKNEILAYRTIIIPDFCGFETWSLALGRGGGTLAEGV
jgi:hypothetical protein